MPIFLLKPIDEIRRIFNEKIAAAAAALKANEELNRPQSDSD